MGAAQGGSGTGQAREGEGEGRHACMRQPGQLTAAGTRLSARSLVCRHVLSSKQQRRLHDRRPGAARPCRPQGQQRRQPPCVSSQPPVACRHPRSISMHVSMHRRRRRSSSSRSSSRSALACCEVGVEDPLGAGAALPCLLPVAPVVIVFLAADGNHVGCHHVAHAWGRRRGGAQAAASAVAVGGGRQSRRAGWRAAWRHRPNRPHC